MEKFNLKTRPLLIFTLLVFTALGLLLIWNYLHAVIFGFIFGGLLMPIHKSFTKKLKMPSLVSGVLVAVIFTTLFLLPLALIVYRLSLEVGLLYNNFGTNLTDRKLLDLDYYIALSNQFLQGYNIEIPAESAKVRLEGWLESFLSYMLNHLNVAAQQTLSFLWQLVMMLMVLVGVLTGGEKLKKFSLSLLSKQQGEDFQHLLERFHKVNHTTIVTNSVFGLIQAILIGIYLWFLDFETSLLLATLTLFSSFIPGLGILAAAIPISLYLYFQYSLLHSIAFLVAAFAISFLTENALKPRYLGKNLEMSAFILFLSITMGITEFGFIGIFYGPLIIGLLLTAVKIWQTRSTASAWE